MSENSTDNGKVRFPIPRDYYYAIGIFVMAIIFVISAFLGGSSSLVQDLGLAATLISITLGVVAILMSLFQSLRSDDAANNIKTSTEVIENATKKLSDTSKGVESMSITVDQIQELLQSVKSTTEQILSRTAKYETLRRAFPASDTEPAANPVNLTELFEEGHMVHEVLPTILIMKKFRTLSPEEQKMANVEDWLAKYTIEIVTQSDETEWAQGVDAGQILGYFIVLHELGYINMKTGRVNEEIEVALNGLNQTQKSTVDKFVAKKRKELRTPK